MQPVPRKLSVLVPVYNREGLVGRCLASALAQLPADGEIIVSDNASTDRTLEVVRQVAAGDPRVRILESAENRGPLANWRRCLAEARGSHLHWLWSDDYCLEGFYEEWGRVADGGWLGPVCFGHRLDAEGIVSDPPWFEADVRLDHEAFLWRMGRRFDLPVSPAAYILPAASCRAALGVEIPDRGDLQPMRRAIGPDLLLVLASVLDAVGLQFCASRRVAFYSHAGSITISSGRGGDPYFVARHYFHAMRHYLGVIRKTGAVRLHLALRHRVVMFRLRAWLHRLGAG